MRMLCSLLMTMMLTAFIAGCSSQQFYGAGQAMQRNECVKVADFSERQRCMASANASYDDYRRQAEEAKAAAK